jgi:capsular polysaccharide biosynthesis protein
LTDISIILADALPWVSPMHLATPGEKRAALSPILTRGVKLHSLGVRQIPDLGRRGVVEFPPLTVYQLEDVTLKGADIMWRNGSPFVLEGVAPGYVHSMYPATSPQRTGSEISCEPRRLDAPALSITHWTMQTYGHFLVEMLPKVVAFRTLKSLFPDLKLVVSNACGPAILEILEHFAPGDLFVYDHGREAVQVRHLLLVNTPISHGVVHPMMSDFTSMARMKAVGRSTLGRKLYVSKQKWREAHGDYRHFEGEREISNWLSQEGFVTVHPEELDWLDQVAAFSGASIVVGEYTSALHNALFAPPGCSVIAINRVNEVQDAIAAYAGHRLGYVMPSDGQPRGWTSGGHASSFSVSLMDLKALVSEANDLGISKNLPPPAA